MTDRVQMVMSRDSHDSARRPIAGMQKAVRSRQILSLQLKTQISLMISYPISGIQKQNNSLKYIKVSLLADLEPSLVDHFYEFDD